MFLADENISIAVIRSLRSAGHEVVAIAEINPGARDEEVLQIATDRNLILITEDRDFGELVIRHRIAVLGLLLLEMDDLSIDAEARRVLDVIRTLQDKLAGSLIVIEPTRTRLRPLPDAASS